LHVCDRVAGYLHGATVDSIVTIAFAQYLVIDVDLVYKIPVSVSLEEAATLLVCANTGI